MKKRYFLPIFLAFCIIFLFYVKRLVILKFYPPICNFCLFLTFFFSLFSSETIIQKFAGMCGDTLSEQVKIYTRKVTYAWCVFTFLNFLISVWTIFQSDKIWILYNGFISYILIGLLFGVEYIIRCKLRKRNLI